MKADTYLDYIDIVKYATTWMHARSLRQSVLPTAPTFWKGGPPLLFTGSIRRYLSNRMLRGMKPVNQHLFWSIAQVKRCARVVPDSFVQKSLEKHRAAMSKNSKACSAEFLEKFKTRLYNVVDQMFYKGGVDSTYEYSTNACFENSRNQGGAKAHLMRKHVQDGDTSDDELLKMDYCPKKGVSERRGYITQDHSSLMKDSKNEVCEAKVYSICEPMKIRNITAGNALPYTLAKGMQKYMHSSLKKYSQFSLIGKSLDQFTVHELLGSRRKYDLIASGDFSAATDNIKIELTKLTFEAILNTMVSRHGMTNRHADILRRVLYEHKIHYSLDSGLEPVEQQNGQLMGSVLSFPILCIINLITYWISVCPWVTDFKKLGVLVNGDDIMFNTDNYGYQNWLNTLHEAGLTPSPGKNFFHKKFGTVNSALFYRKGYKTEYVPFYNVGMIIGQSKVARVEEGRHKPIHCLHQNAMHGALNPISANLRFCEYNREELISASQLYDGTQLNWYVPRTLGGLGMKLPAGVEFRSQYSPLKKGHYITLSDTQRVLAHTLRDAWYKDNLEKPPFKPIGMEVDPDVVTWGNDIKKHYYLKAQLLDCPMLPDCEDIPMESHSPNWYLPYTGSIEKNVHKFQFIGLSRFSSKTLPGVFTKEEISLIPKNRDVRLFKTHGNYKIQPMLPVDNVHFYQDIKTYKLRSDRSGYTKVKEVEQFVFQSMDDYTC
jgi:hypothetical protein